MKYRVTVQPSGEFFFTNEDETVLEAALRCGFFFPHNCRMGVCATCKGKILKGSVTYGDLQILGLNQDEKNQGDALFCSAKPLSDLTIEVNDFANIKNVVHTLPYQVIYQEKLSTDISQLILQAPLNKNIPYQAGQYINILHADKLISPMSISSAPFDLTIIELHLYHPLENALAQDILKMISEKKELLIQGPYGDCTAARIEKNRPLILMARGTGFAPIKAILQELVTVRKELPIHFFWGGENYLKSLVEKVAKEFNNFKYTQVTSGSISKSVLEAYPELSGFQVYAVDSFREVEKTFSDFTTQGLPKEYFYSDCRAG